MELDLLGTNLLAILVAHLVNVTPGRPQTYIGYKQCHHDLGLPQLRERWGESLKEQGLSSLANWTEINKFPAITGIIINLRTNEPGQGYFRLFNRNEDDFAWWEDEVRKSKEFDWSPYISEIFDLVPVDLDVPERENVTISRIVRDSTLSARVKALNSNECQICGLTLDMPAGKKYSEAHHIQPLGQPHDGPDIAENMICVCPNHHALLDYGAIALDYKIIESKNGHDINKKYINYHNKNVYQH